MEQNTGTPASNDGQAQVHQETGPDLESKAAWIRYRIEHRQRITNELVHQEYTNEFTSGKFNSDNATNPVFEVVTTYRTGPTTPDVAARESNMAPAAAPTVVSIPSYHMNIYSPSLIDALHSVVKYYPSQDLTGDMIVVRWPYPVLVHHYSELQEVRDSATTKGEEVCIRQRDAKEHIDLLLKFLDDHIMANVRAEQERNKKGSYTWEYAWVACKPGVTVLTKATTETEWKAQVIHSMSGGTFVTPSEEWKCTYWYMEFDGEYLGRCFYDIRTERFDGEGSLKGQCIFLDARGLTEETVSSAGEEAAQLHAYGKTYWNLLRKQCKHYKGKIAQFPFNEVRKSISMRTTQTNNVTG
jgi:hypothetical protein